MSLYHTLELCFYGSLVANLFGMPQPLGRALSAVLFVLLVVLAVIGRHS
jgi:hypothetical protein